MGANQTKSRVVAGRIAERRRRELEAPRLAVYSPDLASLQIKIIEVSATSQAEHRKHVVVQGAPALFDIPCGDERCEHGGHDITTPILNALRARKTSLQGEHSCEGETGSAPCTRKIRYELSATYLGN